MYKFGVTGTGRNGFLYQLMTSQVLADNAIEEIKLNPSASDEVLNRVQFNLITDYDQKRIYQTIAQYKGE